VRHLGHEVLVLLVAAFELVRVDRVGVDESELGSHVDLLVR
jgi:hypothetical protein